MDIELRNDGDTWYGVTDAKKRKRIQNRLAQRSRRKRLATDERETGACTSGRAQSAHEDGHTPSEQHGIQDANAKDRELVKTCHSNTAVVGSTNAAPAPDVQQSMGSDHKYLTRHVSTVFAAMFNNGRILGLYCGIQIPRLSPPFLHIPWIDRFPFPKMRDNAIRLGDTYYEEEFLDDLFTKDSFTIVPGSVSWDPKGWIITTSFSEKWGYLFR